MLEESPVNALEGDIKVYKELSEALRREKVEQAKEINRLRKTLLALSERNVVILNDLMKDLIMEKE